MNESEALIQVDASDPDGLPDPLVTRLNALTGTFDDPTASSALYTCGAPGFTAICVTASDGNRECDQETCIAIQCPTSVPTNVCPRLHSLVAIPSTIPEGQDSSDIEVRADDPDTGPLTLTTTLYALHGTFDDPNAADTVYHCERPSPNNRLNEICVDASDGACVKTLCVDVVCPDDLGPPCFARANRERDRGHEKRLAPCTSSTRARGAVLSRVPGRSPRWHRGLEDVPDPRTHRRPILDRSCSHLCVDRRGLGVFRRQ